MRTFTAAFLILSVGAILSISPPRVSAADVADLIFFNGKVITVDAQDHIYQAIAIKGGKVLLVGSDQTVKASAGTQTRQIDLKGKTITPGLIDSHYHMMYYGAQFWPGYLNIRHPVVSNKADLLRVVGDRAKELKPDEWISGNQGFHLQAGETLDRWDLDAVAPNNPAYLRHGSGQYSAVNTKALDHAGITSTTPNPQSSVIGHDSQGQLNGLLFHYPAENLVGQHATGYGDRTAEQKLQDIEVGQQYCLRAGYTSVQDVIIGNTQDIQYYKDYSDTGKLKVRVYALLYLNTEDQARYQAANYKPPSAERLKFGGWKLAMDGGLAAGTTLFYDKTMLASNMAYPYFSQEVLNRMVQVLHDTGLQVAVHVSGDQGMDMTVTAFEQAILKNPRPDPRHRIEHGMFPATSLLNRMKTSNIILSTQPQWIAWHGESYAAATSPAAMATLLPLKTLLSMGVPIAFGCDVPASLYQEPKWAFVGAVTRQDSSGNAYTPDQKITIQQALRIHTMGSAYAGFAESTTGSLEPGKFADLVVWTNDPYTIPPEELVNLASDMTVVNGEIVYDSGKVTGKCTCDINSDGYVNIQDFQLGVGMVLGTSHGYCADINGDGIINILDVQIVVAAALDPQGRCQN
jgi:predicted amidohydrolase YtcJ